MIALTSQIRVFLYRRPTDMRKSFHGLVALTESELKQDPLSGSLFVFLNRRGHVAQILFWDRNGFIVVKKRLEAGTFRLVSSPADGSKHVEIDAVQLGLMLEGIDLAGATRRKRYHHAA